MKILVEREAEDFLEKNGFRVAKRKYAKNLKEAVEFADKIGYPVVMKIYGKSILHKTEVNGVRVDLRGKDEVIEAFNEMQKVKGFNGVMVQEYLKGEYVLIGLNKDETFGHVAALGTGGIYTEMLNDVSLRVCPLTRKDADDMIEEVKIFKMIKSRGKKVNIKAVKNAIMRISRLSEKYKNIKELDVNPLIVNSKDAKVADARIIFL